jgi:oligopeptide transport system ATP-binding protein
MSIFKNYFSQKNSDLVSPQVEIPEDVILRVTDLKQHFKTGTGKYKIYNKAVDGVTFDVKKGEVFSLVGESGCGKTTTGRTIIKLYKPTDGEVYLLGKRICAGYLGLKNEIADKKQEFSVFKKESKRALKLKLTELKGKIKILSDNENPANSDVSEKNRQIDLLNKEIFEEKEKFNSKISAEKERIDAIIKTCKEEISARKEDQSKLYRPNETDVLQLNVENDLKIQELRNNIDAENEAFKNYKSHAFDEVDNLNSDFDSVAREEVHKKCLSVYRQKRAEKNKNIADYEKRIDHYANSVKFFNRPLLNKMQMIFQDPIDSLDPRMTVKDIIAEGLYINGIRNQKIVLAKVYEVLKLVGLLPEHADHYPHEFSGGQRQRVGIARAIICDPELIIADEPISALDVSIQAQVINLLNDLRNQLGLTVLFIAHDLSVVKFLSDKVAVMYYGKIVEMGTKDKVFNNPLHPYTLSLMSSIPMPDPNYEKTRGPVVKYNPSIHNYKEQKPSLKEIEKDHYILANDNEFKEYQKRISK